MLDLHVDFILQRRLLGYSALRKHRALLRGQPMIWHADLPRMQEADYTGACLGIHYLPWESERGWRECLRQLDYLDTIAAAFEGAGRVRAPGDWEGLRAQGRMALAPGVEGAHMLNRRTERIEELARRGIAYLTLTHFATNSAATTSWGRGANQGDGLTAWGRELITELERCDILVDVTHVNTPGVLETCELASRPVLCTHSGARALHDHPRMLTDAELDAIAATGGVIGVIFGPYFLAGRVRADSACILDHVEYIAERVGLEHVALGSDFDGWMVAIPSDMRDCRDAHLVPDGLAQRGWSADEIERVCRGNAMRLLARTW